MRHLRLVFLLTFLLALAGNASAQFRQSTGSVEFEVCGAGCTFVGTWAVQNNNAQQFAVASTTGAYVEFQAIGCYVLIYRATSSGFGPASVLLNGGAAATMVNNNALNNFYVPYVLALVPGTNTIRVTNPNVFLDSFVVLDCAATPVPTATILPSSTPALTVTPQPTSTPQPTATPQPSSTPAPTWTLAPSITPQPTATPMVSSGGSDAASVYATVESGQMTRFDYVATAGNVHIANLLLILFFSLWGMFLIYIFVVWQGKK